MGVLVGRTVAVQVANATFALGSDAAPEWFWSSVDVAVGVVLDANTGSFITEHQIP